jgi:hypothetical protein
MDPFTMAELLIGDMQLTSGQLAQLRAINTKYFTEVFALEQKARRHGGSGTGEQPGDRAREIPDADLRALDALIARDIRDILTEDQRAVFDIRIRGKETDQ